MTRGDAMTEGDWPRCKNPGLMFDRVRRPPSSPRKLRLATVACCRAAWPRVPPVPHPLDAGCFELLDLAERYADGAAKFPQLAALRKALAEPNVPRGGPQDRKVAAAWYASARDPAAGCTEAVHRLLGFSWGGAGELDLPRGQAHRGGSPDDWAAACLGMVTVVRDVFGNPFRPAAFPTEWRTATAVGLAGAMYDGRDISALPVLADALEEAGCDVAEVLAHCRGDRPHVRGCWVVDGVLGL